MSKLWLILFWAQVSYAGTNEFSIINKTIYGEDNRQLISELDTQKDINQINLAKAVLAQVAKWKVKATDESSITFDAKNLATSLNYCHDEKFSDLPLISTCSAFLVAPDLILTAGHCVKDTADCKNNFWILDYNLGFKGDQSNSELVFQNEQVVTCSQILSWSNNPKLDYALIKINRTLTDRSPLKMRRSGALSNSDSFSVIGHPLGLPKMITDTSTLRNNSLTYTFLLNADTFSGNSGSPVINSVTNLVEGILIKGGIDFQMDIELGCNRSVHCDSSICYGETAMRTTVLPLNLIPKI